MKVNLQSLYKKFLVSTAKTGYLVYSSLLVPPSASKDITVPWTDRDRLITCCSCPWGHLCYRNTKNTFFTNSSPKSKAVGNLKHRHRSSLVQQSSNLIWTLSHFSWIFHPWSQYTEMVPRSPTFPEQLLRNLSELQGTLVPHLHSIAEEMNHPPHQINHPHSTTAWNPFKAPHYWLPILPAYVHPYVLGKPNYSLFLTLTWNFVANTEPSTWYALPLSKCPPQSPTFRDPGQMPPPSQGLVAVSQKWHLLGSFHLALSNAYCISHTCVSYWCPGNNPFYSVWRAFLFVPIPSVSSRAPGTNNCWANI